MTRESKTLVVVAAVAALFYFTAFAGTSVTEHDEISVEHDEISVDEQLGDATISVEACVVRVETGALEEFAADSDLLSLGSIPAQKILDRVGHEGAEVVSMVKLGLGNESVAEMTMEENSRRKDKDHEGGTGEYTESEISISFQAEAFVIAAEKIAVKLSFKQIVVEKASLGSGDGEQEKENVNSFDVSSRLAFETGKPCVAGAKKDEDAAMFLILRADF
ncbi:MAG: hypothetical protein AMJ65_15435 [Phycisphaerae bacterium SG8_4]|nr:MAG: hypothetical protein AMJ65_15435 [Phycisphaerae bacterium SG8_4]